MIRRGRQSGLARVAWLIGGLLLASTHDAYASNDALLKLLEILRNRGSISAEEYEQIRLVADAPATALERASAALPRTAESAPAAVPPPSTDERVTPLVNKALAGKWYERIGLRGYTQFRYADVLSHEGPALEVPADRTVNENESFVIRRGRFIFSGDAAPHVSLYAQMDFNGSTGAPDFALQMRDLYADVWLDSTKLWRVRLGQSKVPYGFVNLQSSQNRAAFERPDALNSAVEGERDLGASLMWNTATTKQRFREVGTTALKGSGDYGMVSLGLYAGQGLNRPDQNGDIHAFGRVAYPFKVGHTQYLELGLQGYRGRFVSPVQAITVNGASVTPSQRLDGVVDQRVAVSAVLYPKPFGLEAEWTAGRGPTLSPDLGSIEADELHGGYVQAGYQTRNTAGAWFPFSRWNYYDGARKFARNAPRAKVNEIDFGVEFARWAELELTGMYTHSFTRTRTGAYPYALTRRANRLGVQLQWNY